MLDALVMAIIDVDGRIVAAGLIVVTVVVWGQAPGGCQDFIDVLLRMLSYIMVELRKSL